ncbi:concanavalin A-like lectin/glucanase domain-containing protein [Lentinula raphanica]|nr:concanavalin A-like lectin/glucanase domain-containing protein [Lentinula raphanica]
MFETAALIAFTHLAVVYGQQAGTSTVETRTPQKSGNAGDGPGNEWDATVGSDGTTCTENCALDGADHEETYGITTSGNALTLKFFTDSAQKNGTRVYLMAPGNLSALSCGLSGAFYFSEMDADRGICDQAGCDSTFSVWATPASTAQASPSTPPSNSPRSSPNSSLWTAPHPETSPPSVDSTSRTGNSSKAL